MNIDFRCTIMQARTSVLRRIESAYYFFDFSFASVCLFFMEDNLSNHMITRVIESGKGLIRGVGH